MRNKLPAVILLILGGLLIATSGRGCEIPWPLPSLIVAKKYPDAWLVFVEESSAREIDLAILLQNKKWTDSLAQRKINYRVYDQDQDEAKSYKPLLKDLPQLFFVTPDGRVRKQTKSPSTARQADELIAEVMGK